MEFSNDNWLSTFRVLTLKKNVPRVLGKLNDSKHFKGRKKMYKINVFFINGEGVRAVMENSITFNKFFLNLPLWFIDSNVILVQENKWGKLQGQSAHRINYCYQNFPLEFFFSHDYIYTDLINLAKANKYSPFLPVQHETIIHNNPLSDVANTS